ncbi:hypothetical protein [Bradyrhizobium commune]|uniref:Uncharacterized protein n=1 Tax=Bradyrhizobium commune TaxID=83627 RepID=A0A7S9D086_9BRAD|nr:hypothetical protein [Bradyrhizobium commune]QPF88812.1 hypothetical protein IC761_20010 [Bradyrhizobium commune]
MAREPWQVFEENKRRDEARRSGGKGGFPLKDVLVVSTSTAAFLMSATTTYLSSFRELDDVRVVVAHHPMMWHEPLADKVKLLAKHDMTFSNAGNRSAAITAISLYINRNFPGAAPDEKVSCEHGGTASSAAYDIKPFTIAPRETIVKSVHLVTPDASPDPDDGVELSLQTMSTPADFEMKLHLCILFAVVTPDVQYRVRKELSPELSFRHSGSFRYNVPRRGETRSSMFEQMEVGQWVLVKAAKTIFTSNRDFADR